MQKFVEFQQYDKPLHDDIIWSKPEQIAQSGRLLIIGGNAHAIAAPSEAYSIAMTQGVGEARVVLPDKTRRLLHGPIPVNLELVPSTPSGSFSTKAEQSIKSYISWSDATLFAGDIGRNSETAILFEKLANTMPGKQIYTKDALDYFSSNPNVLVSRDETVIVGSISQLQKMYKNLNTKIAITYDMGIKNLCDALQELTTNSKCAVVTQYGSSILCSYYGNVTVTKLPLEPKVWRLKTAAAASVWWLQTPSRVLDAISTAITQLSW